MKKDFSFYWKLFSSTFYLSAFTFGGGYVIVPLMRKKFVDEYHWIDEKEILDITAIAQSTPGSLAVHAAILIGYRLAGFPGALVAIIGTVLPPLILLSIISTCYTAFESNRIVKAVLKGMQSGVSAVIADVVLSMGDDVVKEKNPVSDILMIAVFFATYFFNFNVIATILICGGLGAVKMLLRKGKKSDDLS